MWSGNQIHRIKSREAIRNGALNSGSSDHTNWPTVKTDKLIHDERASSAKYYDSGNCLTENEPINNKRACSTKYCDSGDLNLNNDDPFLLNIKIVVGVLGKTSLILYWNK